MQSSSFTPPGMSMSSGIAIHEADVARLVGVDAGPSRPFDRRPAMPKAPLRERLRRPLLILLPVLLAAVGTAYYLA
jgi:hypothetical protein